MALFHSEADMKHPSGYALIRRHLRRYPHALRQHLLQELNWLVTYEPVIGIMGKPASANPHCATHCSAVKSAPSMPWKPAPVSHSVSGYVSVITS
jgi:hypothetical protein